MTRFRKLPVEIDACQFLDSSKAIHAISEMAGIDIVVDYKNPAKPVLKIKTLAGTMRASVGDWIIKGVKGELYPCRKDIFEETHEAVE